MKKLKYEQFIEWFVGFTEAEGCFKIKPRYRDGRIISFQFEFEIHLHIDDFDLLVGSALSVKKTASHKNGKCLC